MKKIFLLILIEGILVFFSLGNASSVLAYDIEKLINVPVENDFTLGPGKLEVFIDPGSKVTRYLLITNRLGRTMDFKIEKEDFQGDPTGKEAAVLLGGERGPYSLRDYLHPEVTEFTLEHGERITLPVEINIPQDAEPGGLYGSVLIVTSPPEGVPVTEEGQVKGEIKVIGRIGALFFVRTKGDVKQEGKLEKFDTADSRRIYQRGPIAFRIFYRNTGNVHLDPYGLIEIKNILGKKIGEIEIGSYFAMPQSLRLREVSWERGLGLGHYTATLSLNRGYQDIIDTYSISFWILPWRIILIAAVIIFVLLSFFWWVITRFEIRRKK